MRNLAPSMVCLALAATLLACTLPEATHGPATLTPGPLGAAAEAMAQAATATPRPRTAAPGPTATRTTATTAPTTAPSPTLTATPTVALPDPRLPAVLAEVSFAADGGDAYGPSHLALDGSERAVLLCLYHELGLNQAALVVVDLRQGTRGPVLPLPFGSVADMAVTQGRAYVEYTPSGESDQHVAAVDLETGRVVADVSLKGRSASMGEGLLADPAGRIYLGMAGSLEVRDGATLALLRRLPWPADAYDAVGIVRAWLTMDPAGQRLYVGTPGQIHAYRTADLSLAWEVPQLSPPIGDCGLVADAAGRRVYTWHRLYELPPETGRLVAYDAENGQALEVLQFSADPEAPGPHTPEGGSSWELCWADSEQGYLLFCGHEGEPRYRRVLWKAGSDGRPLLAELVMVGSSVYAVSDGRVLASSGIDQLGIFDLADLHPLAQVTLGVWVRDTVADAEQGRLYVNDSAGRLHVLDARDYHSIASLQVGSGALTLDAANHLLFVGRSPRGPDVAVVDTAALAVAGVITGGDTVAVDSAGRRAFVGSEVDPEIQVWDTRTLERLASIPLSGRPAYNPLRDELYLEKPYGPYPAAVIVDAKSLAITGEVCFVPPSMRAGPSVYTARYVAGVTVDLQHEVIAADLRLSGHVSPIPEWQAVSARTLEPLTHTVTLVHQPDAAGLVVLPAEAGHVFARPCTQFSTSHRECRTIVYRTGTEEVLAENSGLLLDLLLPGTGVGLMRGQGTWQAFDLETWAPLGSFPDPGIRKLDPASGRLYAWQGSTLTVLGHGGD